MNGDRQMAFVKLEGAQKERDRNDSLNGVAMLMGQLSSTRLMVRCPYLRGHRSN